MTQDVPASLCPRCGVNVLVTAPGVCLACGAPCTGAGVAKVADIIRDLAGERDAAREKAKALRRVLERLVAQASDIGGASSAQELNQACEAARHILRETAWNYETKKWNV